MLRHAMPFTARVPKQRYWQATIPNSFTLQNGGNSYMAKARERRRKAYFPASVNFTADLHSMGQYIQEGQRNLFETVISILKAWRGKWLYPLRTTMVTD
jgi:hypothetical protein